MTTPAQYIYPLGNHLEHGPLVVQAFRARSALSWHEHGEAYVSLVASGAYHEEYACGSRIVVQDTAVFHPAGESHCDEFDETGGRIINLTLSRSAIGNAIGSDAALCTSKTFTDGPVPFLIYSLARAVREKQPGWRATAHEHVTELVGHIADHGLTTNLRPPRWLDYALAFIRGAFNQPIGLAEVSTIVGVHPAHVAREFRRHLRTSVGDYVRKLRIAWACEELTRGRLSLVRVALEAGFFDQAHFCRAFRQECGVPPSQFRRSVRV